MFCLVHNQAYRKTDIPSIQIPSVDISVIATTLVPNIKGVSDTSQPPRQ